MKLFGISAGWILAASVAASFLSGVYVTRLYYLVDISQEKLVEAKEQAKIAESIRIAHEQAVERQNATETLYGKKLKHAQDETARIASLLASGNYRLRLAGMPEVATHSSPAATGAAIPSSVTESAYLSHRNAIDIVSANLELCIQTLKNERGIK